jgi:hypothetical protein
MIYHADIRGQAEFHVRGPQPLGSRRTSGELGFVDVAGFEDAFHGMSDAGSRRKGLTTRRPSKS